MRVRPIDEMPAAVRDRIEGVVFDVDDTVTRDGRLERVAFDAMWRMHEGGLRLVALTGRPLGWCDVLARHWPVDVAIGENGAGWLWRDGSQ
ncbi:MAG: HAD hydrolase family protein, partial [Polyangiales bacterium]